MTKTQFELIKRAQRFGGTAGVDCYSGTGPKGGKVRGGQRERDALFALEKDGLIVITNRDGFTDYKRGYGVHITTFSYRLTYPIDAQFKASVALVNSLRINGAA